MFSLESAPQRLCTPWFALAAAGALIALLAGKIAPKLFPGREDAELLVKFGGIALLALGAVLMICFS